MEIQTVERNAITIALVKSDELLITDVQSALDLIATVHYETGSHRIVLRKCQVAEDFFKLSTRLAGDVLQKFINYRTMVAIVGDYSGYTSKPLKDFIYESNHGRDVFFVSTQEEAIERLASA